MLAAIHQDKGLFLARNTYIGLFLVFNVLLQRLI